MNRFALHVSGLVLLIACGCGRAGLGVRPETPTTVPPDALTRLREGAAGNRGASVADIVGIAENTVTEQITARTQEGKDYDVSVIARDPVLDPALLKVDNSSPWPARGSG